MTHFINSNTKILEKATIQKDHIIPVFAKDNEPLISQIDFIDVTEKAAKKALGADAITDTTISMSHPIKGRVPEARYKKASELKESEKTVYFERMAFSIDTRIQNHVNGNEVHLTIAGVKAYNRDNLYRSHTKQRFQLAIGFKVFVCSNLAISGDMVKDFKAIDLVEVEKNAFDLFSNFSETQNLELLQNLGNSQLSEQQFANILGRGRMYQALPSADQKLITDTPLLLSDTQLGAVTKDYYKNKDFKKSDDGSIDLWKFQNLLTEANKSSYIDTFLDRAANATDFSLAIADGLETGNNWFLN